MTGGMHHRNILTVITCDLGQVLVAHACKSNTQQTEAEDGESETNLGYTANSKLAWATKASACIKKNPR